MKDAKNILEVETLEEEKELGVDEIEIEPTIEPKEPKEEPTEEPTEEEEPKAEEAEEESGELSADPIAEDNEPAEEKAEEEEAEAPSEESEEAIIEEAEEEKGEEDDDDEAEEDEEEEELSIVSELREQIQTLTNKINELAEANAKLKKTNRKLSAKYQNELDKKAKFKEELKGLSVELLPDEGEKEEKKEMKVTDKNYYRGDGIGEI